MPIYFLKTSTLNSGTPPVWRTERLPVSPSYWFLLPLESATNAWFVVTWMQSDSVVTADMFPVRAQETADRASAARQYANVRIALGNTLRRQEVRVKRR